jgi:hypothetical protein
LLTVHLLLTAAALVVAMLAFVRARRIGRRLEQVVESYWELRYESGQLRAQLEKAHGKGDDPVSSGATAFVPLARLRSADAGTAPASANAVDAKPAAAPRS